ncbi:MAG: hypothetical protein AB7L28_27190, partial [Kofleriaceae bacterium]
MPPRQIGAVLALVAAVLLAASIALPWWSGHFKINGEVSRTQIVKVGMLGGQGCNEKSGNCSSFKLAGDFRAASYAGLGTTVLLAICSALFAVGAFQNAEWRKRLYAMMLGGAAAATLIAIAMIAIGPTPQSNQHVSMPGLGGDDGYLAFGVFAFGAAIIASVVGAVFGMRANDPIRLAPAVARFQDQPISLDTYAQPSPALPPEDRPSLAVPPHQPPVPAPAQLPPPAPSPAGNLPGPAGPLGFGQAPSAQPPAAQPAQPRPLHDALPHPSASPPLPIPPRPLPAHPPVVADVRPGVPPPAGRRSMPDAPTMFGARDAMIGGPPAAASAPAASGAPIATPPAPSNAPGPADAPAPPVRSTPQVDALLAAAARGSSAPARPRPVTGSPPGSTAASPPGAPAGLPPNVAAQIIPGAPLPSARRPSDPPPSVTAPTARHRPLSAPPPSSIIPSFSPVPRGKPTQPPPSVTIAATVAPPPNPVPGLPKLPGVPRADTDQEDGAETKEREHMREQAFDAARTMYRPKPAAPTPATSSTGGDTATDRDEAATARASERISNDLIATRVAEADAEDSL